MINDYESTYKDLLNKIRKPSMNVRKNRGLCIEIYKNLNNLNRELMKDLNLIFDFVRLYFHGVTKGVSTKRKIKVYFRNSEV